MGSVRQRRKKKSSLPKVRPKSKPKLTNPKSNPIIAKNWDNRLTLAQNYRKLGLTVRLNAPTGSVEKSAAQIPGMDNLAKINQDPLVIVSSTSKTKVNPAEVKVKRDPKTGKILEITDSTWQKTNPLRDPLAQLVDEWDSRIASEGRTEFVKALEKRAANEAPAKPKQQSQREQEWIQQLVEKHGDDYEKMRRDKKLNVYQFSEGDIKSRIKKWKKTAS